MAKHTQARMRRPAANEKSSKPAEAPAADLLTMDEAILLLKTTRPTFYRWIRSGRVKGLKVGRQWRCRRGDMERFLTGQAPRTEVPVSPEPLVRQLAEQFRKLSVEPPAVEPPADMDPADAAVARAVGMMIALACHQKASDLHLGPHFDGSNWSAMVRTRIDGVLRVMAQADVRLLPSLVRRWKTLAGMNVIDTRTEDGRIATTFAGAELDIRVSVAPVHHGETLTARILSRDAVRLDLDALGYWPSDKQRLMEAVRSPSGLVVFNGPAGCGKTTSLYSCLQLLARPEMKLMSIEDPVEYLLPWVDQMAVNEAAGLGFARAVRTMLRSDVDVLMVGEIRDRDIAMACAQAAMTGHMVLTTLHAAESAQALRRLVEIGVPAFVAADATKLIVTQRLVRQLCRHCSRPVKLSPQQRDLAEGIARVGGVSPADLPNEFREAVGCERCVGTGYRGRKVIAETLTLTPGVSTALRRDAGVDELRKIAVAEGMTTMAADGVRKAAHGQITLAEVCRILAIDEG